MCWIHRSAFIFLSLFLLFSLASCSSEDGTTGSVASLTADCPVVEPEIIHVPITAQEEEEVGFYPDFTVITVHDDQAEVLDALERRHMRISNWTRQALMDPEFSLEGDRDIYHLVVVSMLELGFLEDEIASYDVIVERAAEVGLLPVNFEVALALREQYLSQPEYMTGHRLGEFFIAVDPVVLVPGDPVPKIPSLSRDDEFPHEETGIGLWIVLNNIVVQENGLDRGFNPLDPEGADRGGRFCFAVPDHLNLDIIREMEQSEEE